MTDNNDNDATDNDNDNDHGPVTVSIPDEHLEGVCLALFAGELGCRDIGEMDADAAAEDLRETLMGRLEERDPGRVQAAAVKLKAYAMFDSFRDDAAMGGGQMGSIGLDADDVPEDYQDELDEVARGEKSLRDLSPDATEFIVETISDRTGAPTEAIREALDEGAVGVMGIGVDGQDEQARLDDPSYQ